MQVYIWHNNYMSLFNLLKIQVTKNPNKTAIVIDENEYSYTELLNLVIKTIDICKKKGIKKNSIILILENNTLFHVLILFAASYLNITVVPVGSSYTNQQVLKFIKVTNVNCIIGNSNFFKFFNRFKKI